MNAPAFSRAREIEYGAFYYELGLVKFTLSARGQVFVRDHLGTGKPLSPGDRDDAELAYEVSSLLHEMRHFHDMFGTIAGISQFSEHLYLLKIFCVLASTLRAAGVAWQLPLADWVQRADCPPPVRDFWGRAQLFQTGSDCFRGAFAPIEVDGHDLALTVEVPALANMTIDAFPTRVTRISAKGAPRLRSVLYPIGFDVALEGSAHAITRTLVDHYFSDRVVKTVLMDRHVVDSNDPAAAAGSMPPYMVADLLVSRYMQQQGQPKFSRNAVLGLIDETLSSSRLEIVHDEPGARALVADRIGRVLLDALHAAGPDAVVAGTIPADPAITDGYRALLAAFGETGDWNSIADDNMPLASVQIWEAYMTHRYIMRLLEQRLATDHRAFRSYDGFFALFNAIGLPPARSMDGKLMLDRMPPRVQAAWHQVAMLGAIVHQLTVGDGSITCPRRQQRLPGLASINMAMTGDCRNFLPAGCGRLRPGVPRLRPDCLFESGMRVTGLG